MDRRLCLQVLISTTACILLPGAAFAAIQQQPLVAPQPRTGNELAEPVVQEIAPDPLYAQAVAVVMTNQKASISLVQRHLKLGYNRAARLLLSMEQAGLIGSQYVNDYRQILVCGIRKT
ncbi:MAG: DNA translocase FtsK [Dehalococcoidia bacterium]|nr:DNA translocase FtsK [Chloroflexota bacterium]